MTSSSSITIDSPIKNRKLRKMILPSEIAEEEEEEETEVHFVRKPKVEETGAQKVVEEAIQRGPQLIVYALLDQAKEQLASSEAQMEENAATKDVLKTTKDQVIEAITSLNSTEGISDSEASFVPK